MTVRLNTCSWNLYKVLERYQVLGRWQGKLAILYKDEGPLETKEREQKEVLRFCSRLGAAITSVHHPSIHQPFMHPSIIHPPVHPSIHQSSVHLSFIHPPICPSSVHPSIIHPFILAPIYHPPIHPSVHPSIHSCTHSSISHLPIHPSLHPSTWKVRKRESGSRRPSGVSQCHHAPCSRSMENNSNPSQEDSS